MLKKIRCELISWSEVQQFYPWAVYEDISDFLRNKKPAAESIEQSQKYLANEFNIRISKKSLEKISI